MVRNCGADKWVLLGGDFGSALSDMLCKRVQYDVLHVLQVLVF